MITLHIGGEFFFFYFIWFITGVTFALKAMAISRTAELTRICFAVAYLRDALKAPEKWQDCKPRANVCDKEKCTTNEQSSCVHSFVTSLITWEKTILPILLSDVLNHSMNDVAFVFVTPFSNKLLVCCSRRRFPSDVRKITSDYGWPKLVEEVVHQ